MGKSGPGKFRSADQNDLRQRWTINCRVTETGVGWASDVHSCNDINVERFCSIDRGRRPRREQRVTRALPADEPAGLNCAVRVGAASPGRGGRSPYAISAHLLDLDHRRPLHPTRGLVARTGAGRSVPVRDERGRARRLQPGQCTAPRRPWDRGARPTGRPSSPLLARRRPRNGDTATGQPCTTAVTHRSRRPATDRDAAHSPGGPLDADPCPDERSNP